MPMGTFQRTNLFYGVDHEQVYAAWEEFWRREGHSLEALRDDDARRHYFGDYYTLHEQSDGWTVLNWTNGWEWDLRRRAQLHVSRVLDCPGLLVFIYDDDFWGCELFNHGSVVDQFQQQTDNIGSFFGDLPCKGRPDLLLAQFPALNLDMEHARGYLTHYSIDDPAYEDVDWEDEHDPRNSPVRPGDGCGRLDGGAFWAFKNFLGAGGGPAWRRFTTEPTASA
ncbi:hypothetical protein [Streptacidiphilus anmyonensis]|uniref:hypothetical protein n=1 Tax=Streptacidiphilus anmyonensis TaxID=405782 RepID=UPI00128B7205|nr:hypothetical protein [Streptacidiphilus anmyonensis]